MLLAVDDLQVSLPGLNGAVQALRGVSFTLERGQTLGLIGESGCGKSLTALALMGLLPEGATVRGRLRFDGLDLNGLPEPAWCRLRGQRIAMVFQEPMTALNPLHTIGRQVAEALRLHRGLSAAAARAQALRLLQRVQLPQAAERLDSYPHQLSGGQRQRVLIAAALACGPQLLIADEPTSALDATLQGEVLDLLLQLVREDGMALLLISHDLALMARRVQRLMVMYAGRVVESGPTAQVFAQRAHPYTQGLYGARPRLGQRLPDGSRPRLATIPGRVPDLSAMPAGCAFAERCALAVDACRAASPAAVTVGPGHSAWCLRAGGAAAAGEHPRSRPLSAPLPAPLPAPLLQVDDLARAYRLPRASLLGRAPQVWALQGVSFQVQAGRSLGVVGASGSGKSTLARLVMALERPSRGRVLLQGQDLQRLAPAALRRTRGRFQMVFQDPFSALDPRRSVLQTVSEPLGLLQAADGVDDDGATRRTTDPRLLRRRAAEALDAVGLRAADLDRLPHEFSGGQRQRIAIARALITRPALIVADEPVSALDVSVQAQVLNLMAELQRSHGVTYLLISHDLAVVDHLCRDVVVLDEGRVVEQGPPERLFTQPRHAVTQRLLAAAAAGG